MKNLLSFVFILLFVVAIGCNKNSNNYSTTDHTVGMTGLRSWSGYANGYFKGDTITALSDTTVWALSFARTLSDTSFAVQKINGFEISVLGTWLNYFSTDSFTNHIVKFDTVLAGAATTTLTYYYLRDSMTYEFHNVSGYNSASGQYYQTNEFLHTN